MDRSKVDRYPIAYTFNHMHPPGDPNERRGGWRTADSLSDLQTGSRGSDAMHDNVFPAAIQKQEIPVILLFLAGMHVGRNLLTHDHIFQPSYPYIFMLLNKE